jgi:demethylmenaquinone methyltransferase / 2-methoxy-6-polyprenyl-1,4-benzoquinol methylase
MGHEPHSPFRDALPFVPWVKRGPALRDLFEEISPSYDRLNHWLSAGLDQWWRKWAARELVECPPGPRLDVASGTGDLAAALQDVARGVVVRMDLSAALLRSGERKLLQRAEREARRGRSGEARSPGVVCEMDRLPFRDGSFAALAQGFALRHCRGFESFFGELFRVVAPGGRISLLDMRVPSRGLGSGVYRFYFLHVLPGLAALLGGRKEAYRMMVDSVLSLPQEESLIGLLVRAGFVEVRSREGLLGAVALLTALRP